MGLFRLLTFILVALVAWRMIKNYRASVTKRENNSAREQIPVREKMVKCEMCDVHLPEEEAIIVRDGESEYWFCTPEHRDSFKQQDS